MFTSTRSFKFSQYSLDGLDLHFILLRETRYNSRNKSENGLLDDSGACLKTIFLAKYQTKDYRVNHKGCDNEDGERAFIRFIFLKKVTVHYLQKWAGV